MNKALITAAITGAIHVPTQTEYLPITPDQIADEAIAACQAGAAVIPRTDIRPPILTCLRPSARRLKITAML